MNKIKRILSLLLSFLLFLTPFGVYLTNRLMYIKKKDDKLIIEREKKLGWLSPDLSELPKKEVIISSPFHYNLKVIFIEPHATNRYMIICHGVTENKINSSKYMALFLKKGFNVVVYDHRRHGESGGKTTSYGYYEKFDLEAVVRWLKTTKGTHLLLGIHGESMGAATMLLYAGMLEDGADFYISDCAFSDFREQIAYLLKRNMKLPSRIVLPITDVFLRIREKYSLQEISPISVVHNIQKPVLFIHSQQDDYILPEMTEALYRHKKGPKQLFLAPNGRHAQSLNENKKEYEQAVDQFIHQFVFNNSSQPKKKTT